MKKIIALMLVLCAMFAFTSCSSYDEDHEYFDARGFVQEYESASTMKKVLENEDFDVEIDENKASLDIYTAVFASITGKEYKFKTVLTAEKVTDEKRVYLEVYFLTSGSDILEFKEETEDLYASHEYSFCESNSNRVIIGYVDLYEDNAENTESTETNNNHIDYH